MFIGYLVKTLKFRQSNGNNQSMQHVQTVPMTLGKDKLCDIQETYLIEDTTLPNTLECSFMYMYCLLAASVAQPTQ